VWSGVVPDIERITSIWQGCMAGSGGPWLFGRHPSMADAMYAPECTRFVSYGIDLDPVAAAYVRTVSEWPDVREWVAAAETEPDLLMELQGEF
jgi:glutathione S-transferase